MGPNLCPQPRVPDQQGLQSSQAVPEHARPLPSRIFLQPHSGTRSPQKHDPRQVNGCRCFLPPAPLGEVPCLVPKGHWLGTPVRMVPTQPRAQVAGSAFLSPSVPCGAPQKALCAGATVKRRSEGQPHKGEMSPSARERADNS